MTDLERLLEQLKRTNDQVRATQLSALSELDKTDLAALERLWSAVPATRRRALAHLMNEIVEDNVDYNFETACQCFLTDDDPEVRLAAIEGLWECTDPKLIARLFSILRTDPEDGIRAAAATALGRFVLRGKLGELRERYLAPLEQGLIDVYEDVDESISVRRRAIEALGPIDKERISDLIEDAFESEDDDLRASAIYAMGRSADARWLPTLEAEAESAVPQLRYEVAVALGEIEDQEGIPILVRLIDDVDPEVRQAAVTALGKVGGRDAERALRRMLKSPSQEMREAAEEALSELQFFDDLLDVREPGSLR